MSGEKRLRDFSSEDLDKEMKRRRAQEANCSTAVVPRASNIGQKAAEDILKRHCFLTKEQRKSCGEAFPMDLAISLLRQHPKLVALPFNKETVFSYFLRASASIAIMAEICSMWKAHAPKLSWRNRNKLTRTPNPVADFCLFGQGDTEILLLLMDAFPNHLSDYFYHNHEWCYVYPIVLFLDRCALRMVSDDYQAEPSLALPQTKQILEILLTHDHVQSKNDYRTELLAPAAVTGAYGKTLSPFLLKILVEHSTVDSLCTRFHSNWTMHSLLSATTILPKLKTLKLLVSSIDTDAWVATLNYLHCSPNHLPLEELELPILPEFLQDRKGKDLMVAAMQSCKSLKTLELYLLTQDRNNVVSGQVLCSISKDIIQSNPGITSFCMSEFSLDTAAPFGNLLAVVAKTVKDFMVANGKFCEDGWEACPIAPDSKLEEFAFDCDCDGEVCIEWTRGILQQLRTLPKLQTLDLQCSTNFGGLNMGEEIAAILSKGRLKELTLNYYSDSPIEWDHVISALKQNTSLESLDYENGDDNDYAKHRQIRYYTTLNRHGRSKLRALGAKKEVLVSCLCSVHGDKYDDFTEHDVHYGLLRQAPSLWADAL